MTPSDRTHNVIIRDNVFIGRPTMNDTAITLLCWAVMAVIVLLVFLGLVAALTTVAVLAATGADLAYAWLMHWTQGWKP